MSVMDVTKNIVKRVPWLVKLYERLHKLKYARLTFMPFSYDKNGLFTIHNSDFQFDERFVVAFTESEQETGFSYPAPWRCYVNAWAVSHALNISGDMVECGVYKGFTSHLLCRWIDIDSTNKTLYLVDSFEGLDEGNVSDAEKGMLKKNKQYAGTHDQVKKAFAKFQNVSIVKGFVPDVLSRVNPQTVSYLHIDMNYVHPEIAAAEYFWDRLSTGAVIVLDDYGFKSHIEQKKAFDLFARERGILVLPLPTGQGIMIKS